MEINYKKCKLEQRKKIVKAIRKIYDKASIRDIYNGVYFVVVENNRITAVCYVVGKI